MIDITTLAAKLKAAGEKATPGEWVVQFGDEVYATNDGVDFEQVAIATLDARDADYIALASPANILALVEALEAAGVLNKHLDLAVRKAEGCSEALRRKAEAAEKRIAELEARTLTVKLPDGWHFEECETDECNGGAVYSVGAGMKNIHLCDECSHDARYSRMKKTALPKRLPFKVPAGIKLQIEE